MRARATRSAAGRARVEPRPTRRWRRGARARRPRARREATIGCVGRRRKGSGRARGGRGGRRRRESRPAGGRAPREVEHPECRGCCEAGRQEVRRRRAHEPRADDDERREARHEVERRSAANRGKGQEAEVEEKEKAEEDRPEAAVVRHRRERDREERRQGEARDRQEDPPPFRGGPGETAIEKEEVRKESSGPILTHREERRRREAAEEPEARDERRVMANRERDGERRHERERRERGEEAEDLPPRVCGVERGEKDGESSGRERACRDRITPRGLELAGDQNREAREKADRHLDGGREPAALDGITQEEDRAKRKEDAGRPRKQLYADESFPVDAARRGGRRNRGFLNDWRSEDDRRYRKCDRRSSLLRSPIHLQRKIHRLRLHRLDRRHRRSGLRGSRKSSDLLFQP